MVAYIWSNNTKIRGWTSHIQLPSGNWKTNQNKKNVGRGERAAAGDGVERYTMQSGEGVTHSFIYDY